MKTLTCADLGMALCNFVAKGETDQAVMDMMMEHVKVSHPEVMDKMDMEQMKSMMMSKMKTM